MKLRRAVLIALIAYITTLVATTMITISTGISIASVSTPPLWLCVISVIITIIISWITALIYFHKKSVKKGSLYGFYLGLCIIIVGFILDLITWLAIYPGGRSLEGVKQLLHYYATPFFWITLLIVMIVNILTGKYRAK